MAHKFTYAVPRQPNLQKVLSPLSAAEFLNYYCKSEPVYVNGALDRFEDLLGWDHINEILLRIPLSGNLVQLYRNGERIPEARFIKELPGARKGENRRVIIPARIQRELRAGAHVILNKVHEFHPPLAALVRGIEEEIGDRVAANLYIGAFPTKGFGTHWDGHDVLVMQIHGRKSWRIFKPSKAAPMYMGEEAVNKIPPEMEPVWQGELSAGDILYIPRGWWHDAVPVGIPTVHITLGIIRPTGIDFTNWLRDELKKSVELRTDMPRFGGKEVLEKYVESLRKNITEMITVENIAQFLDGWSPYQQKLNYEYALLPFPELQNGNFGIKWIGPKVGIEEGATQASLKLRMGDAEMEIGTSEAAIIAQVANSQCISIAKLCLKFGANSSKVRQLLEGLLDRGLIAIYKTD